jgi:hypothetical protein
VAKALTWSIHSTPGVQKGTYSFRKIRPQPRRCILQILASFDALCPKRHGGRLDQGPTSFLFFFFLLFSFCLLFLFLSFLPLYISTVLLFLLFVFIFISTTSTHPCIRVLHATEGETPLF